MLKFEDLKEGETRLQEKKARAPRTKPRTATVLYLYPGVADSDGGAAAMLQVDSAEGYVGSATRLTWKQIREKWEMLVAPKEHTDIPSVEADDSANNDCRVARLEQQLAYKQQRITELETAWTNMARDCNFQQKRADSLQERLGERAKGGSGRLDLLERTCVDRQQQINDLTQQLNEAKRAKAGVESLQRTRSDQALSMMENILKQVVRGEEDTRDRLRPLVQLVAQARQNWK